MHRTIYQKIIIALICLLSLIIPSFITKISASSELATCNIIIKGKENQKYKAGLAIKFEEEAEKEKIEIENAITSYKDEEGYEFIGMYSEFTTIDTLFYEYIFEKNLNFFNLTCFLLRFSHFFTVLNVFRSFDNTYFCVSF